MNSLNHLKKLWGWGIIIKLAIALALVVTLVFISYGQVDNAVRAEPVADPVGNHDGSEGIVEYDNCNANGWTVDPDDYERDLTVQVLSDGSPVITTTASQLREDIPPEICPEGTCGFSTSLWGSISAGVEHEITAQAYDQETDSWINLEGTPKALTCWGYAEGSYDGPEGVVGSDACSANGWTADPDDFERDLTVQILSDGSPVVTTTANLLREGIDPEICPQGTCGFSAGLWGLISPGVEHLVMAQVYDQETESWIDLAAEPKSLTCWGYPQGNYDGSEGVVGISACNALGWAVDPDEYERDLTVQILSDGVPVATTTASLLREDIDPEICPGSTCGFFVDLWKLISPRTEHQIAPQVYDEETESWIDLDLEPKFLTCWGYELYLPSIVLHP